MMNCNDKHSINNPRDCLNPCEHPKTFNRVVYSTIIVQQRFSVCYFVSFGFCLHECYIFYPCSGSQEWQPPRVILPFLVIANVTSSKASSRRAYHLLSCHHLASNKLIHS